MHVMRAPAVVSAEKRVAPSVGGGVPGVLRVSRKNAGSEQVEDDLRRG